MDMKVSTDPKIIKMFRKLERFLDGEGLANKKVIDFYNAETGRVFATVISPTAYRELVSGVNQLEADFADALATIALLEDYNALLGLIDAQNDVIMGWSTDKQNDEEIGDGVGGNEECSCKTTEAASPETAGFEGVGPIFESFGVNAKEETYANVTIKEHFNVEEVTVTLQEYEELLNLRKKRARDKHTIYELEAKFKAMKKSAQTLQAQRDEYAGRLGIALDDLADADGVTRWIR
jgi:hypothetical protein